MTRFEVLMKLVYENGGSKINLSVTGVGRDEFIVHEGVHRTPRIVSKHLTLYGNTRSIKYF